QRYGRDAVRAARVWRLPVGERQKLEVIKLLLADAQVLILDEPTRNLAPHEVRGLFQSFDALRRDRYAVVFIAHKLHEVLACADRMTVMRRGRIAGTLGAAEASESALINLMFGGGLASAAARSAGTTAGRAAPILELDRVSTRAAGQGTSLDAIHLVIRPGEIVGIAGGAGNGQRAAGDLSLG